MSFEVAGGFKNLKAGNIDEWRGPYATVAAACDAIPNVLVDGVNFRKGKIADIGNDTDGYVPHRWKGGYGDEKLVLYIDASDQIADSAKTLFKSTKVETPALSNIPVIRSTAEGVFENRGDGFGQTTNTYGLKISIPDQGTTSIKHYLKTGRIIPAGQSILSNIRIDDLSFGVGAVGIGYVGANGVFNYYCYGSSGTIRYYIGFSPQGSATTVATFTVNDTITSEVIGGILIIKKNGTEVYRKTLTVGEFQGELIYAQVGFLYYSTKLTLTTESDPVKSEIANQINTAKQSINTETDAKLVPYVKDAQLDDKAQALFSKVILDLFPEKNLPVTRILDTGAITNYPAGYNQTVTSDGLSFAIPNVGNANTKHFANTLDPFLDKESVKFIINQVVSATGSVGIAYLNSNSEYVGYVFSMTGVFRKSTNTVNNLTITTGVTIAAGDTLEFVRNGLYLTVYKGSSAIYTHTLDPSEFTGTLYAAQTGFINYTLSTKVAKDPIRDFVKAEVSNFATYPNCFYEYKPTGSDTGYGRFTVYVKYAGKNNKYIGYDIDRQVQNTPTMHQDYWRLVRGYAYIYENSNMLNTGLYLLASGENELALKTSGDDDFLGGYHGNEQINFVKFLADGVQISPSLMNAVIPLTQCGSFEYIVESVITKGVQGGVIDPNHTPIIKHFKKTLVRDEGYKTTNNLEGIEAKLVSPWYAGICCMAKPNASVAYLEKNFTDVQMIGAGDAGGIPPTVGYSKVNYRNDSNGASACVEVNLIRPSLGVDGLTTFVSDRSGDSKFYSQPPAKTLGTGERWGSEMIVKHFIKQ